MAVSMLERGEIQHIRDMCPDIGRLAVRDLIPKILDPMPESALEQLDLNVIDIDFYSRRLGKTCLVLVLDDPDKILFTERQIFTNRLSKDIRCRHWEPHLTIAKINEANPVSEIKDWVESRCPASISVDPVSAKGIVLPSYAFSK